MTLDRGPDSDSLLHTVVGRRAMLRAGALGGAGLAAAALIGCGDDDDDDDDETPQPSASTETATPSDGGPPSASAELAARENARAQAESAPYDYHFADPPGEPKSGGTLILASSFPAGGPYDPTKSQSGTTLCPVVLCTNRLVGIKTGPEMSKYTTDLTSELASSWEVDADGLTYTFHLQDGVKWHNLPPLNGRALVASDIVNTYDRYRDSLSRSYIEDVESFTAPDDATLVMRMSAPNADILVALATHFLTIFPVELADEGSIGDRIVGTGPMMFEGDDDTSQYLTANTEYWGGKPYLDGFEVRHITDPAARTAAFRAGQVHNGPSVATRKADAELLLRGNPDTRLYTSPILTTPVTQGFNLSKPKFADERVRQALSLAVDRDKFIEILYAGDGAAVPSQAWTYVFDERPTGDELGKYFHLDLDESRKLLTAAGADDLEFTILISNTTATTNVETLAGMYKEAGVTMNIQVADYNEYLAQVTGRSYSESATSNSIGIHPAANYFYNLQINSTAPQQYWYMNDDEIDVWSQEQKAELDPQARREILRNIWDKMLDQAYKVDLPYQYFYHVWNPDVRYARFQGPMFVPIETVSWLGELGSKTWLDS